MKIKRYIYKANRSKPDTILLVAGLNAIIIGIIAWYLGSVLDVIGCGIGQVLFCLVAWCIAEARRLYKNKLAMKMLLEITESPEYKCYYGACGENFTTLKALLEHAAEKHKVLKGVPGWAEK